MDLVPDSGTAARLSCWPWAPAALRQVAAAPPGVDSWLRQKGWRAEDDLVAAFVEDDCDMPVWSREWPEAKSPHDVSVDLCRAGIAVFRVIEPHRWYAAAILHRARETQRACLPALREQLQLPIGPEIVWPPGSEWEHVGA